MGKTLGKVLPMAGIERHITRRTSGSPKRLASTELIFGQQWQVSSITWMILYKEG